MQLFIDLFFTFARIGAFTFGGGYAILPILERDIVDAKGWITTDELMDYYAVGQCTPGIIAVNTATFIGYKTAKIPGAIIATAGLISPSIVIITVIASFIQHFSQLVIIQHAFAGIRIAVCALVLRSVYQMAKRGIIDWLTGSIFLLTFLSIAFLSVSPILAVLISAILGIAAGIIRRHQA